MALNKTLVIAGALMTAGLGGLAITQAVGATADPTGHQSLVDKISSKFNLDKNEVQKVFEEDRQALEATMQARLEERLKQAVEEGKITQELADQLLAKHKEMHAYRESIKDKPAEERHALMKAKTEEMAQWLKDNNIDKSLMRMGHVKVGGPEMAKPEMVKIESLQ